MGRCFVFPRVLLSFNRAVISWCRALGGIGVRDGNGFALWPMGRGCSEYSVVRRKHSAQRRCEALRAVSLQFVRFYAFSRLRRESPRVLLRVMRICDICYRFPFLIACKRREYSMNCDFLIWWFPEKILILPSENHIPFADPCSTFSSCNVHHIFPSPPFCIDGDCSCARRLSGKNTPTVA